jgi:hypothetical protein
MTGNTAVRAWLSVWPPESASTVMSSATGTRRASSASPAVSLPASDEPVEDLGRGRPHEVPGVSGREILAKT